MSENNLDRAIIYEDFKQLEINLQSRVLVSCLLEGNYALTTVHSLQGGVSTPNEMFIRGFHSEWPFIVF